MGGLILFVVMALIVGIRMWRTFIRDEMRDRDRMTRQRMLTDQHDIERTAMRRSKESRKENVLLSVMDPSSDWLSAQRKAEKQKFRVIYGYDEEVDIDKRYRKESQYLRETHRVNCDADNLKSDSETKLSAEQTVALKQNIKARLAERR